MCNHIPASLPDDLQSVGYNRQCHQRFPTNIYLLGDETEPEASILQQHHSPRKMSSTGPLFCEREVIKDADRKTEQR